MSRIEVQIMGQSYVLASPDGGEDMLQAAAAKVDAAMCSIRDAGKIKARERIAVLACLNMAFEAAQSAASGSTAVAGTQNATLDPATSGATPSPAVDALIHKLDEALTQDGQLL
jgi:cell division protein ZapA